MCQGPQTSAPQGPDKPRWVTFLASSALVGATAILALVISLGQLFWPVVSTWLSSYSVEFESPDLVNLFCAGSEGIDADVKQRPICNGDNSIVLLATPLYYVNKGGDDRTVWLRREVADVDFLDDSNNSVRKISLVWQRVSSGSTWQSPGVEQIEPNKAISHSTLFYPSNMECSDTSKTLPCSADNHYSWSDFSNQIINRKITQAIFSFRPVIVGPDTKVLRKCQWRFTEADVADLRVWQDDLNMVRNIDPRKTTSGSVSPPYAYLSANCIAVD